MLCCGGLSCALQEVQQHLWSPPIRCQYRFLALSVTDKKKSPGIAKYPMGVGVLYLVIPVESHKFRLRRLGTWPFRLQRSGDLTVGPILFCQLQFSADSLFLFFREPCPVFFQFFRLPIQVCTQGLGKVTCSYTDGPQLMIQLTTFLLHDGAKAICILEMGQAKL